MRDVPGGVDCCLGRVYRAHDIGVGGGVQAESPGDAGNLPGGEHQPQAQQGVVLENHQARHQHGGLKERSQAQSDDLLDPLDKPVYVAPGDAEHVKTAHGDLDEQDAATLQIAEKHLDYGVGHEDDAEQQHEGAGEDAQAKVQGLSRHIHQAVHALEVRNDGLSHGADTASVSGESGGEGSLQGD